MGIAQLGWLSWQLNDTKIEKIIKKAFPQVPCGQKNQTLHKDFITFLYKNTVFMATAKAV